MNKFLTKALCVLAFMSFASVVLAQNNSCEPCKPCEICPPCEPCKPCCTEVPKTGEPCNCAYNAPARIDPACGWDAWISGSFLYWQAKEKGLDLGLHVYQEPTTPPTVNHYDIINMDFDYHPAFKIGLGWSTERDDWTMFLEYTRFKASDSESKDIRNVFDSATNTLTSVWFDLVSTGEYSFIKSKWTLDYNLFDLELGRPYYLGRKLIFKPFYGLRGGWIDQKLKIKAIQGGSSAGYYTGFYKQDTWLVGPRVGLDTDWLISCDFRIFGNVAASLDYQKFKVNTKQQVGATLVTTDTIAKGKDKIGYLTPNVEFSLGLGYGTYFCNNEWYFDLTLGYDFNYFWNQNFMRHLTDFQSGKFDCDAGNLMLHGLNITARLDF